MISFLCIIVINCSKDDEASNVPQQNEAPNTFNLIAVTNGASDVDVLPSFSWQTAVDPDMDVVMYDLYLDTNPNPTTLHKQDISGTNFKVEERLYLVTDYYWKVTAKDSNGNTTESNVHKFTTRNLNFPLNPVTNSASFSERSGHSTVSFQNKFWVIGGSDGIASYKNDVLFSNNGSNWVVATMAAAFIGRLSHTTTVFGNKIWVIGGAIPTASGSTVANDVWNSEDGITWTQVTSSAPFSERALHTTTTFDNKLWVIGGLTSTGGGDLWFSADGITWTQVTISAPFSDRYGHTTTVFDNKLWLIGGYRSGGNYRNDIWSSTDGINWTEVTSSASFSPRRHHSVVVFDDKLWLFGGEDSADLKNDVWSSTDGTNWTEVTSSASFSERESHTMVVFDDKIWLIGGDDGDLKNDVWMMD